MIEIEQEIISIEESSRLVELEKKIERGLDTFVQVGEALLEIRDSRLYRVEHKTFEDYCRVKWGMSRQNAHELIGAVLVNENLSGTPDKPKITAVSQARPLTKLPPEEQPAAWAAAVEKADGKQPTAKQVEEAVLEITEPERKHVHVSQNSGENEWYTPAGYIQAAREVMGSIDTDPASCLEANRTVEAKQFFTKEDDGLGKKWKGNVWMNPPYSQPLISKFADAVASKFEASEIKQACVLVNNATETQWFQRMLCSCSAVCFMKGRVRFIDKAGNATGAPLQGQAVLYFGGNMEAFKREMSIHGVVLCK
jgi:phage N-6-adenine-methyltransferase